MSQSHPLQWTHARVPVSQRFDDPFYSLENGPAETRHVFLRGNGLPEKFEDGFHIAELGFGTGLNLLTALASWREAGTGGVLRFTSFEAFPLSVDEMAEALKPFSELAALAHEVLSRMQKTPASVRLDDLDFRMVTGDARQTVPRWDGLADCWFLDGFSPAKNPELWGPELMQAVHDHTTDGGSAATYTAAGHVRRGLEAAGFTVQRVPGFGRKRHMSVALKELRT